MKIHILENCLEVAPVITPKEWKEIVSGLLVNVKKIDAPIESSYMGVVGGMIIDWLQRETGHIGSKEDFRHSLGSFGACTKFDDYYWFKLEGVMGILKSKRMSFEQRKLTHFLKEDLGCDNVKITIDKKELRVWKVPCSVIDNHVRNNQDHEGENKKWKEQISKINYKPEIPY